MQLFFIMSGTPLTTPQPCLCNGCASHFAPHGGRFTSIPQYINLYKPKHHFCTHLPSDILMYGPPRHYWCSRFEAMNQVRNYKCAALV